MSVASVVIPTLNEEANISNVLHDLQNQTVDCEIIVVDSNSSDNTASIARDMGARVIVTESTIGKARHIGTLKASCDKVLQTDADARIPPEWAEKHVRNLDDYYIVSGPIEQPLDKAMSYFNLLHVAVSKPLAEFGVSCPGANMGYRKSKYLGFSDINFLEDGYFLRKMTDRYGLSNHKHDLKNKVWMEFDYFDWGQRMLKEFVGV